MESNTILNLTFKTILKNKEVQKFHAMKHAEKGTIMPFFDKRSRVQVWKDLDSRKVVCDIESARWFHT